MTLTLKNKFSLLMTSLFTTLFVGNVHATDIEGSNYFDGVLNVSESKNMDGSFNSINETLKSVLGFARGAGIVVCVIMLTWCAIQLAMSSGNNQKRQIAMEGIKNVMIAVAIIGGATLICSIAYGILLNAK